MSVTYVPAGVEAYARQSAQLAVTYATTPQKETTVLGRAYKRWNLRDRTVELVKSGTNHAPQIFTTADAVVSIFSPKFLKNCGVTKVLVNPIHGSGTFRRHHFHANGLTVIVDSGGFQLLRGTVDFVNPDDVVQRYNEQADICMPLDLPVVQAAEEYVFNRVSNMIRANDEYIESRLAPGKHLALISHGTDLAHRKARLDVLGRHNARVVAIAGLNIRPRPGVNPFMNSMEALLYVTTRYRKTAQYFHVLGVTSTFWMFVYSILSVSRYVHDIGADSVSPRVNAITGTFLTPDFQSLDMTHPSLRAPLPPCSCPVCFTTKDSRLLTEYGILESHNVWVYMNRVYFIEALARDYLAGKVTDGQVFKGLRLQTTPGLTTEAFRACLQYLKETIKTGKFRRMTASSRTPMKLFASAPGARPKIVDRYEEILSKYEAWHKKKF